MTLLIAVCIIALLVTLLFITWAVFGSKRHIDDIDTLNVSDYEVDLQDPKWYNHYEDTDGNDFPNRNN